MDLSHLVNNALSSLASRFHASGEKRMKRLQEKFRNFAMIDKASYLANLQIARKSSKIQGNVVECVVRHGDMIASITELLGKEKKYHLKDSFEGPPEAKEIDVKGAMDWQKNTTGDFYFDNCKAQMHYVEKAMYLSKPFYACYKGRFCDTLPNNTHTQISPLCLDGDWYNSTMDCLKLLFLKVAKLGVVLIDDYQTWNGCNRAVQNCLSSIQFHSRISSHKRLAYIINSDSLF